jgi:AhpD family alkylhydroperoxidase
MSTAETRITAREFNQHAAAANAAFTAAGKAVAASGLEEELLQLIKLRASQINGCAYCTQLHINECRHMGMAPSKIDLLVVWREAGIYSDREKAALTWTELLTRIADHHVTDEDYAQVSAHFPPAQLAWLSTAVALINAWNRLAAPFQYAPFIPGHEIQASALPAQPAKEPEAQKQAEPEKEPAHA